eukprot:227008-Hanusia_phi.AAC.3
MEEGKEWEKGEEQRHEIFIREGTRKISRNRKGVEGKSRGGERRWGIQARGGGITPWRSKGLLHLAHLVSQRLASTGGSSASSAASRPCKSKDAETPPPPPQGGMGRGQTRIDNLQPLIDGRTAQGRQAQHLVDSAVNILLGAELDSVLVLAGCCLFLFPSCCTSSREPEALRL